jgi:hypothetical protein
MMELILQKICLNHYTMQLKMNNLWMKRKYL